MKKQSTIFRTHAKAGFTLAEILIVLAIMSILAGIVVVNMAPVLTMGKQNAAKAQIQTFVTALTTYRIAHGSPPTQQQGLDALVNKPAREPIPRNYPESGYLNSRTLPMDPWDRPYLYLAPGRQNEPFEIITYGADGEPGGSGNNADISSSYL